MRIRWYNRETEIDREKERERERDLSKREKKKDLGNETILYPQTISQHISCNPGSKVAMVLISSKAFSA